MYKMLIVDDEYIVRMGISETIEWNEYDIEIVGTAVNGLDALRKIEELKPDIIISDIKMPQMDGIQLAGALYDKNYDGIIIILSGYSDFEYAKGTLEKGVFKYLLKPIDNDELVSVVLKAKEKLAKRRKMDMFLSDFDVGMPIIKNSIVDSIFHGSKIDAEFIKKMQLYDIPIIEKGIVIYCKVNNSTAGNEFESDKNIQASLEIIKNGVLSILKSNKAFYSLNDKRICFACEFSEVETLEKLLTYMLREYEKQCSVVISIGISATFESVHDITKAFGAAKFLATNRLYSINSVYIEQSDSENTKISRPYIIYMSLHTNR